VYPITVGMAKEFRECDKTMVSKLGNALYIFDEAIKM